MSTAKFNQWLNSDGTENFKCRAWVNFNGTGTVAIRASGNVSSITDNGTGDYTVNFTSALSDANYAMAQSVGGGWSGFLNIGIVTAATGSCRIKTFRAPDESYRDTEIDTVMFFR